MTVVTDDSNLPARECRFPALDKIERRFWRKTKRGASGECWPWLGACNRFGYGYMAIGSRKQKQFMRALGHRIAFLLLVGPIPDDLELDHLCRNRWCVNPAHLEAVASAVNNLRGESPAAKNARKMDCPSGHSLTGENLMLWGPSGRWRKCRTCQRQHTKNGRERRRAA